MILMTEDGQSKVWAAVVIGGALAWSVFSDSKRSRAAEKFKKEQAEQASAPANQEEAQP